MYSRPKRIPATVGQVCEGLNAMIKVVEPNTTAKTGQAADARATYEALEGKADKSELPAKVSDLENDAGYLTEHQDITGLATKEEVQDLDERVTDLEENGGGGGGGASVIVNETLTQDGENPVKSKGIWSAIWGAIAAPAASVYAWVTTELGKKQDKLKQGENITIAEDGTISASGGSVDVVAEIAGKEIKPSRVVIESMNGDRPLFKTMLYSDGLAFYDYTDSEEGSLLQAEWHNLILAMPKYEFVEGVADDMPEFSAAEIIVFPHNVNHISTRSFSGAAKNLSFYLTTLESTQGNTANDLILVFDCYVEGYRIEWTEEGKEYTFHPRGGDAANLEVVAGKRNVFFITEVQPDVFMVARDELALPDAGGGE